LVAVWGPESGNSWRTTRDIENNWNSMKRNIFVNSIFPRSAGPGAWNDPDMLEIGVTTGQGMSLVEEKTHFALWAISKAPLLIGADLKLIK